MYIAIAYISESPAGPPTCHTNILGGRGFGGGSNGHGEVPVSFPYPVKDLSIWAYFALLSGEVFLRIPMVNVTMIVFEAGRPKKGKNFSLPCASVTQPPTPA